MSDDLAILPVVRDVIAYEYADGDLAVKVLVSADDAKVFHASFESKSAVFLASGAGAVQAVRGAIMRESRDGGIAFRLLVAPAHRERFLALFPKPGTPAVLAREDPLTGRKAMLDETAAPEPKYGHYARVLRTHGAFLRNPKVWAAIGTDAAYLDWLKYQKCTHCGWVPHWEMEHYVPCDPAHVRRVADGAGTSRKPEYSAIPLCHKCHEEQHRIGESYLGGKEAVDKLRIQHVQDWAWQALKEHLGWDHWSMVPPSALVAWAEEHGLVECLPDVYREP